MLRLERVDHDVFKKRDKLSHHPLRPHKQTLWKQTALTDLRFYKYFGLVSHKDCQDPQMTLWEGCAVVT